MVNNESIGVSTGQLAWNTSTPGSVLVDTTGQPGHPPAYTNVTHDNEYFWYPNLGLRAAYLLKQPHRVIALILIVLVISSNVVSLVAMVHVRGKLTSHIRFLISLALSDIMVAFSVFLHVVNQVVNPNHKSGIGPMQDRLLSRCFYVVIKALNNTGLNIALLNLIGMSVDTYVAVLRPTYYNTQANFKRASYFIIALWVAAFLCGFSDFFVSIWGFYKRRGQWKYDYNFCEVVWLSPYQEEYTVFAIAILCLLTMTYMYSRIYFHVRCTTRSTQASQSLRRSRRILLTTLLVIGTFVVCWLPLCSYNLCLIIIHKVNKEILTERVITFLVEAEYYLFDLLLLNGLFDPIIYTVRIREVQLAYKNLMCSKKCLDLQRRRSGNASFTSREATFSNSPSEVLPLT